MSTTQVQKWVMSILVGTTVGHFALGLLIGAAFIDLAHLPAKVGLLVLGTVTGVLAVVAGRAIHGADPVSAWPVVGVVPGLVAAYLMFGR